MASCPSVRRQTCCGHKPGGVTAVSPTPPQRDGDTSPVLTSRKGTVTVVGTPAGGLASEKCSRRMPLPCSRTSGWRGRGWAPAGARCVTV